MKRKSLISLAAFISMAWSIHGMANPIDFGFNPGSGTDAFVEAVAIQADGKFIIGGAFQNYNGVQRKFVARVHNNGWLDDTFIAQPNDWVRCVAVQPDGKILIGGKFTHVNGVSRNRIARLNADGSLDSSFNPGSGVQDAFFFWRPDDIPFLFSIAVQSDGKILIGGGFRSYNGTTRDCVARLNPDGSLDTSFDPGAGAREDWVKSVHLLNNGKIMLTGGFRGFANHPHQKVVRLNINGSVDTSFAPLEFNERSSVNALSIQADGKYLISGHFTNVNRLHHEGVARLNSDGSIDTSFQARIGQNDFVESVKSLSNGKVLAAGFFSTVNGQTRQRIARLNFDGSLDTSFAPIPNFYVLSMALEGQGKVIIVGGFTDVNGVARSGVARLHVETPIVDVPPNPDPELPGQPPVHSERAKIFWQNEGGNLAAWAFRGSNYTRGVVVPALGPFRKACAFADFNGDGHKDIVWKDTLNGRMGITLLDHTNVISTVNIPLAPVSWKLLGVGDLTQNLSPDFLWMRSDGKLFLWEMNGTSLEQLTLLRGGAPMPDGWCRAIITDLNGDGKNDLLWQHEGGRLAFWLMNGTAVTKATTLHKGRSLSGWEIAASADFNDDRKADILFRNVDGRVAVWIMNGTQMTRSYLLRDGAVVPPGWRIIGAQ